jgi:hypothetical protein
MDIATRKISFVQRFLQISDEQTISKLEQLLSSATNINMHEKLIPMTIEEFNKMIDESENDLENDRKIEARAIINQIDEW